MVGMDEVKQASEDGILGPGAALPEPRTAGTPVDVCCLPSFPSAGSL